MSLVETRGFTTAVIGADGVWRGPPDWLSFSSFREAEECPRRWALRRASFPGVWSESGYPEIPYVASLIGDIVHAALEEIVRALSASGCSTATSPEAVAVLKQLGGYTAILTRALDERVARVSQKPRVAHRVDSLQRELRQRLPEMRQRTQATLSRMNLLPQGPRRESAGDTGATAISDGSYPELELRSSSLGWAGRADLVTVAGEEVHILDYKTGAPADHHADQLRIYALIWSRRDDVDPSRQYVTRLTLSYATHDVEVPPPSPTELDQLEADLLKRSAKAKAELDSVEPVARPAAERCEYCPVRHLCDAYWSTITFADGVGDVELHITSKNGPRSRLGKLSGNGEQVVVRCLEDAVLEPGSHVRVLGAYATRDEDSGVLAASLGAKSEVYEVKP